MVRSGIPSSLIYMSLNQLSKFGSIFISKINRISCIMGPVYFPPNSPITVLDELQDTNSHPTAKIFLGGDFNSPGLD